MKRKRLLIAVSMVFAFSIFLAFQQFTQAQAPGGGSRGSGQTMGGPPSGMMMSMQILPIESEWTHISFGMDVSDEALVKARKVFQDTWNKRKVITDKSTESGDDADARRTMKTNLEKLKTDLDAKLKGILTPKQMENLTKWEKENQNRFRNRQAGGTGGGRPGGGGGQPPR